MASKTRISITIVPKVNHMLEKVAVKKKVSKSAIVEVAVVEYLQRQLEKDAKELAKMKFGDLPSEDNWLELQNETL